MTMVSSTPANAALLIVHAEALAAQRRLQSSLSYYRKILEQFPEKAAAVYWRLGILYQMVIGDGSAARRFYELALENCQSNDSECETVKSVAYENMMLLALSYDEYNVWAERLRALEPDNPILHQQAPVVLRSFNQGAPWTAVLEGFARACYSLDWRADPGRYGQAASTYQLMLEHRCALRMTRAAYAATTLNYAILMRNVVTLGCGKIMEQAFSGADPAEFRFVIERALPRIDRYLEEFPNDARVVEQANILRTYLTYPVTVELPPASQPIVPDQPKGLDRGRFISAIRRATVLISILIGAGIGYITSPDFVPWSPLLGAGIGFFLLARPLLWLALRVRNL